MAQKPPFCGNSAKSAYGSFRERLVEMTETPKKLNGLQQVLKPSPALAGVVGSGELSRGDAVSKVWAYIKQHNLQNPANKREIMADAKLKPVFDGKDKVDMFEMNKHLSKHLSK